MKWLRYILIVLLFFQAQILLAQKPELYKQKVKVKKVGLEEVPISTYTKSGIKIKKVFIFSINNENTDYFVEMIVSKKVPQSHKLVLKSSQEYIPITMHGSSNKIYSATVRVNQEQATDLAQGFGVLRLDRKHPGHQLKCTFTPLKDDYKSGDSIWVKMIIANTGNVPIRFNKGGMYRNWNGRCDYFRFEVYHDGVLLPDEGPEFNFGGIEGYPELKPGEADSIIECISKWSHFKEPGKYEIRCSYQLELNFGDMNKDYPDNQAELHKRWNDKAEETIYINMPE